jgi:hypothetical protein
MSNIYHLLPGSQIKSMEAASILIESIVSFLHDIEDKEDGEMK